MSRLLYYPGFEIIDQSWLKFALLYLDKVDTIVPYSAENQLSKSHIYIKENTDLLGSCNPYYEESEKATDDAIEVINRVFNDPARYWSRFGKMKFVELWREKNLHNFELYKEKFTHSFLTFCETNGFSTKTEKGINVHYNLGLIYMSLLAYSIRDNRGRDVISDSKHIKRFRSITDKTWQKNKAQEGLTAIKSLIELEIPKGLSKIPINKLIEVRNNPQFRKKLHALHNIVDKFSSFNEINQYNFREIKKELDYHIKDLKADVVVNFGTALGSAGLGTYIAIDDAFLPLPLIKELIGAGFVIGGGIQVYHGITSLNEKRLARSYLTQINKL